MKKYRLVCMSFDGEKISDNILFNTIEDVWEYSGDLGSKWYFYPFHFVTTESMKTIKDSPDGLFNGMRLKKVQQIFNNHSKKEETKLMECEEFLLTI